MIAYIRSLNDLVAENAAEAAKEKIEARNSARDRLTPLDDRLARLLDTIPRELQREGLSLTSLQTSLRGRWRGSCHPGELGTALRKLGFQRSRKWHGGEGFQALWYPT